MVVAHRVSGEVARRVKYVNLILLRSSGSFSDRFLFEKQRPFLMEGRTYREGFHYYTQSRCSFTWKRVSIFSLVGLVVDGSGMKVMIAIMLVRSGF